MLGCDCARKSGLDCLNALLQKGDVLLNVAQYAAITVRKLTIESIADLFGSSLPQSGKVHRFQDLIYVKPARMPSMHLLALTPCRSEKTTERLKPAWARTL